jgi:hypothetical protein
VQRGTEKLEPTRFLAVQRRPRYTVHCTPLKVRERDVPRTWDPGMLRRAFAKSGACRSLQDSCRNRAVTLQARMMGRPIVLSYSRGRAVQEPGNWHDESPETMTCICQLLCSKETFRSLPRNKPDMLSYPFEDTRTDRRRCTTGAIPAILPQLDARWDVKATRAPLSCNRSYANPWYSRVVMRHAVVQG